MPYIRSVSTTLAVLLAFTTPSYGQPQGSAPPTGGGHPHGHHQLPGNSGGAQDRGTHSHGNASTTRRPSPHQAPPQVHPPVVMQHQPQQGEPSFGQHSQPREGGQLHRRYNPDIQRYRGPDDYRTGSLPPITQRRNDRLRDRDLFRHSYRAERRFRMRPYLRPRGWYLYDWSLGEILPSLFWTRNYWIVDYWLYGLPIPPDGCVWVRYDNDALLIDRNTGEVIEEIYGIFY